MLCAPIVLLYELLGRQLVGIFLESPTGTALDTGFQFLAIISPFYFVVATKLVSDGILRGAGMMKQFMTATFTDLILRVALAEVLSLTPLETTGIWISWPIGWVIATIISVVFYKKAAWGQTASAEIPAAESN